MATAPSPAHRSSTRADFGATCHIGRSADETVRRSAGVGDLQIPGSHFIASWQRPYLCRRDREIAEFEDRRIRPRALPAPVLHPGNRRRGNRVIFGRM